MIRYRFQLNLVPFWGMLNISLVVRIEMGVRGGRHHPPPGPSLVFCC